MTSATAGSLTFRASLAGRYTVRNGRAESATVEVAAPPEPMPVSGPWTVRFTPGWGAPDSAVFPQLVSWTERAEAGIKYYSGTASYETTFDLASSVQGDGLYLSLDLGELANLAEVRLNGKDLGVLWKPPFRVADIGGLLRPRGNRLEVRVTNLWVNRLIGDEQVGAQRFTHTNMLKFTASSPLRTSGLLGPVRIVAAREQTVKWQAGTGSEATR